MIKQYLIINLFAACNKSINNQDSNNVEATNTAKVEINNNMPANNTNIMSSPTPNSKAQVNNTPSNVIENKSNASLEKVMKSEKLQLKNEDFQLAYNSIQITPNTKVEDITNKLGFPADYEANNQGYISGNAKYRRWNLCYPSFSKPEVRIIVLSERKYEGNIAKDVNSYIVGVYLESYKTSKGLKVGDDIESVLKTYGMPDSFENNIILYTKDSLHIEITLNSTNEKVDSIFIDYNMEKSEKDQNSNKY